MVGVPSSNGAQTAISTPALNVFPAVVATPYTEMLTFFLPYAPFADLNASSANVNLYYATIKMILMEVLMKKTKQFKMHFAITFEIHLMVLLALLIS